MGTPVNELLYIENALRNDANKEKTT